MAKALYLTESMKDAIRIAFSIFDDYETKQDFAKGTFTIMLSTQTKSFINIDLIIKDLHEWEKSGELLVRLEEVVKKYALE
jgi:hypothetical protein